MGAYKKPLIYSLLIALVFGAAFFKAAKIKDHRHFDPNNPGSLFYSETAFHYRYAEIIAEGRQKPLDLLRNDKFVQHPESINVLEYYTVMMEFIYGYIYKISNISMPFNLFLIYFTSFFSSLSLIMVFFIAKLLFDDELPAFMSSLFYVTTPISFLRTVTSPFLREDFTLPFILLSIYLILILLDAKSRPFLSLLTGLVIALSLSSWHFSQFVYICILPFFCWATIRNPELLKNFLITFCIIFLAGLLVPVLKTRIFLTSILMCSLYAIAAGYFLHKFIEKPACRLASIFGVFIVIICVRNIFELYEPAYSHVFGIFYDKLRFFLQKPDNPMSLSFNTRQLWRGAFNSPGLSYLWGYGKTAVPLGAIGALLVLWPGKPKKLNRVFVSSLTIILLVLSVMVRRILVISAPFMSVALLGCLTEGSKKRFYNFKITALLIFLGINIMGMNLKPGFLRFPPESFKELCEWIDSNTKPTDAFVARISVGPMLLLNTGRPQVLHSKFENLAIRKKYEEYINALFCTNEEELFEFCKRNQAQYFVYEWSSFVFDNKDSNRYLAGKVPGISEKANAVRLHFCDTDLKHFKPVFRNHAFIVFKVFDKAPDPFRVSLAYSLVYDPAIYTKEDGCYKNTQEIYDDLLLPYADMVNQCAGLIDSNRPGLAVDLLAPAVKRFPRGSNAVFLLTRAYIDLGQNRKANGSIEDYLAIVSPDDLRAEPFGAKLLELKADALHYLGLEKEAFETLKACLNHPSHTADVYKKLYLLSRAMKEFEQAELYYREYEKRRKNNE